MSTRSIVLVMALALTFSACPAPQVGQLSEEDVAATRSTREAYVQAVLAGDSAATGAQFTEDAVLMPPNQPLVEGRSDIGAWYASFTVTEVTLTEAQVDGGGGLGYERGTYSVTSSTEDMPEAVSDTGKYLLILRKQPDGSWRWAVDIWNSDQPLPE
ncbi:MAG: YybH family protein [Bacteroidota bacterium]